MGLRRKLAFLGVGLLATAALAALVLGIFCLLVVRHHQRMRLDDHIELRADLSRPGAYSGRFKNVRRYVHGVEVSLRTSTPLVTTETHSHAFQGLKVRWLAVDKSGRIILDKTCRYARTPKAVARNNAFYYKLLSFGELTDEPTGTCPFVLLVESPAPALNGVQYEITARHPLCWLTLEAMRDITHSAVVLLSASLVLAPVTFAVARRLRRGSRA